MMNLAGKFLSGFVIGAETGRRISGCFVQNVEICILSFLCDNFLGLILCNTAKDKVFLSNICNSIDNLPKKSYNNSVTSVSLRP